MSDDKATAERMMERIRKLLAKAEDPGVTQAEADAFTAGAAKLMAKFGIDAAMLRASAPQLSIRTQHIFWMDWPYARSKGHLCSMIAEAMRCSAVTIRRSPRTKRPGPKYDVGIHVFGEQSRIEMIDLLFTSTLLQAARFVGEEPVPYGHQKSAFRETWMMGYGDRIGVRLRAMESEAVTESDAESSGTGAELVLVNEKQLAVADRDKRYPNLGYVTRNLTGQGRGAGWRAGGRADLGRTGSVSGGGQRALR